MLNKIKNIAKNILELGNIQNEIFERLSNINDAIVDQKKSSYQLGNAIILQNGEFTILDCNGYYFCFPSSQINHALSYINPEFDIGMRRWVENTCGSGDTFIDIGANVGTMSAIAARIVGREGKVIAIEPITTLERCIRQNVMLNGPLSKFHYLPFALGDIEQETEFEIFQMDNRVSTLYSYDELDTADTAQKIDVKVKPLNALIDDLSGDIIIKVDAEGAEYIILKQIKKLAQKFSNRNFFVALEYGPDHFARAGYKAETFLDDIENYFSSVPYFIDPQSGEMIKRFTKDDITTPGNIAFTFTTSGP